MTKTSFDTRTRRRPPRLTVDENRTVVNDNRTYHYCGVENADNRSARNPNPPDP